MMRLLTDQDRISSAQGALRRLLTEKATSKRDLELGYYLKPYLKTLDPHAETFADDPLAATFANTGR